MKKTFSIFAIIFLFSFFIFPKLSFALSSEKSITGFAFFGLDPFVIGVIDNTAIALSVPNGTNITALVPTIQISPNATVSPASGVPQNFTNGVNYTVTAEDGSTQVYTAVVFVLNNIPTVPTVSLSITNVKTTSVTLEAINLSANTNVIFNLKNKDSTTPSYSQSLQVASNSTGMAFANFSGLNPGGHYTGTVSYVGGSQVLYTANFYTFEGEGSGGGGGGNTPPAGSLVTCTDNCGFKDLMDMINKVINFILFVMAVPIAAIMFAYAGFLLVFSGGEAGKRTKAKEVFINVGLGLVFVAGSWLIIHTILEIVGFDGSWIGL